jgi:hypothetical protein
MIDDMITSQSWRLMEDDERADGDLNAVRRIATRMTFVAISRMRAEELGMYSYFLYFALLCSPLIPSCRMVLFHNLFQYRDV